MCIRDREYLGHTITAKTHKVSYKSKKTRKNEEMCIRDRFCGDCQQPMIRKTVPSKAKKYIYYVCSTNKHSRTCSPHLSLIHICKSLLRYCFSLPFFSFPAA